MQDVSQAWSKIIAKAWSDDAFKDQLMTDPKPLLDQYGLDQLDAYNVKVVEDANSEPGDWHIEGKGTTATYIVSIPPKPTGELSDSELEGVAGAGCSCCCCTGAASDEIL
jgi:hypothetical protein